ncbi:MAG: metallophosphoesterase [Lentimicrobium sp.]
MKIQYCSDLHLEFPENKALLKAGPLLPVGDILLLAGDIVPFAVMNKHNDFFDYIADNFEFTYWIPGNHEYYHADITQRSGTFSENIRSNVVLLNNQTVIHKKVRLVFSTLWSRIRPAYQFQIETGMSDFHVIKCYGNRFSADRFNQLHSDCLNFVEHELEQTFDGKTIVVSHHMPTFMNYPPKYTGDVLNDGFAVELSELIEQTQPHCWIFGHIHVKVAEFNIGNTKLISNQLGYVCQGEHVHFLNDCVIEV